MVFGELKRKSEEETSVDDMREILQCLNSFLKSENSHPDFSEVSKSRIFPVTVGSSKPKLVSLSTSFALVDRQPLRNFFAANAAFFDFTLDQTRHLEPLINWAGLQTRYLSTSVRELSNIEGSIVSPLSKRSRKLSTKAYGLLRYFWFQFLPSISFLSLSWHSK